VTPTASRRSNRPGAKRSGAPKKASLPPSGPDRDAALLRLLIEVPEGGPSDLRSVTGALRRLIGLDASGRQWTVRRLFDTSSARRDKQLSRFFEASGSIVSSPTYPLQKLGFELARRVGQDNGWLVQPDLPSAAYVGGRLDFEPEVPPGATVAAERHLPGAEDVNWSHHSIRTFEAWNVSNPRKAMGEGVVIGHPDTGYSDHPELESGSIDTGHGRDLVDDDNDAHDPLQKRWWWPLDNPGHGTGTASTIVGRQAGRIIGVAPRAKVVPIRAVRSVAQVFDGDLAKAVDYARHSKCNIISMSVGGVGFHPALSVAIQRAVEDGIIVMAAAGNYVRFVTAPASYTQCLGVAATNVLDHPWEHSSRGSQIDISAPGEDVAAANAKLQGRRPAYSVGRHSGTSYGVAHLAGVAALWLAFHGWEELKQQFGAPNIQRLFIGMAQKSCRKPAGWEVGQYGVGIVDAEALLKAKLPAALPPAPAMAARSSSLFDRIAALCPELSAQEVRSRLAALLNVAPGQVDDQLPAFGGEIAYMLSEDLEFRAAFVRPVPPSGAAAAAAVGQPNANQLVARLGSPSMVAKATAV
jgi:subtilase family protein